MPRSWSRSRGRTRLRSSAARRAPPGCRARPPPAGTLPCPWPSASPSYRRRSRRRSRPRSRRPRHRARAWRPAFAAGSAAAAGRRRWAAPTASARPAPGELTLLHSCFTHLLTAPSPIPGEGWGEGEDTTSVLLLADALLAEGDDAGRGVLGHQAGPGQDRLAAARGEQVQLVERAEDDRQV